MVTQDKDLKPSPAAAGTTPTRHRIASFFANCLITSQLQQGMWARIQLRRSVVDMSARDRHCYARDAGD